MSGMPGSAPSVQFWPRDELHTNFVSVVLRAERGRPHFTLDGAEPGPGSEGYRGPLFLTATTLIKAAPFVNDTQIGPVVTQLYTVFMGAAVGSSLNNQ